MRKFRFLSYTVCIFLFLLTLSVGCFSLCKSGDAADVVASGDTYSSYESRDGLFEDYAQFRVKPEYNTLEKLYSYRDSIIGTAEYNEDDFSRAEKVIKGEVRFEAAREFSTLEGAMNALHQYGAIRNYCRDTLKMSRFGSDRQPTGIYAYAGDKITIYLECEKDEYRPYVVFTQFEGSSQSFKSNSIPLMNGKNTFEFPDLKTNYGGYSKNVVLGGPIHIENPRTHEMQGNVKIYIEGGDFYPIFRKGGNEKVFEKQLTEYYNDYIKNSSTMIDMVELVADHVYFTISATACYKEYVTNHHSVNDNLVSWDTYMRMLLGYSGVSFNPEDSTYKEINEHICINIRDTQNYTGAGAYAGNDHVGIYKGSTWETIVVYVGDGTDAMSRDWGFAHEIGHMIDTREVEIAETTNNMYSKFAEMNLFTGAVPADAPTHDHMVATFEHLVSDDTAAKSFFQTDDERMNYFIWWYLEATFPGFWPRLQNLYRYEPMSERLLSTEKMVYLSSLAAGIDLSYYFERWGYVKYSYENIFKRESATETFEKYMQAAIREKRISDTFRPKIWYQNAQTYENLARKGLSLTDSSLSPLFEGTQSCEIIYVHKSDGKYTIKLKNIDDEKLLGYEIIDSDTNKVVGFTYNDSIILSLSGNHTFKAIAYDIYFRTSAVSEEKGVTPTGSVCERNGIAYSSLAQAISESEEGDTIKLLDDIREEGIIIRNSITVMVSETVTHNITFFATTSEVFYAHTTLRIIGRKDAKIIFDGGGASRTMGFIRTDSVGDLTVENAVFRNTIAKGSGGALYGMNRGNVTYKNCLFENMSGSNGGAIYIINGIDILTFEGCTFRNNTATYSGGAIKAYSNKIIVTDCYFEGNKAKEDTIISHSCPGELTLKGTTIKSVSNGKNDIEAFSGELKIYSDCYIDGLIYSTKPITLCGGVFNKNEHKTVTFDFSKLEANQPAFISEDLLISSDMLGKINDFDANQQFRLDDGKVFLGNEKCIVTFKVNGNEFQQEVNKGDRLTLDGSHFSVDNKYSSKFQQVGGDTYNYGETITVNGNLTFEVTLADLLEIKWITPKGETSDFVAPGEIYLPRDIAECKIVGWIIGDEIFASGIFLNISESSSVIAISEHYLYVIYRDNGKNIDCKYFTYGSRVTLPELEQRYVWFDGSSQYLPQSEITLTNDTIFEKIPDGSIQPKDISKLIIEPISGEFIYNGGDFTPSVTITDDTYQLIFGKDYNLTYFNNTDAGEARVLISAIGENYFGTVEVYFTILKAEGSATATVDSYTFGESEPQVIISSSTNSVAGAKIYYRLVGDHDFVEFRPTDAGKYEIKVVLESSKNYKECTIYATFEIFKAEQPDEMPDSEIVVGRNIEKLSEVKLPSGWDWEEPETKISLERITAYAKYRDTKNYNKCRVIVTIIKESRKDISAFSAKVNEDNFIYDGSEKTPGVTVTDGEIELQFKQDYELEYSDNTDAGKAKIIIRGINNYTGTKEIYFTILKAEGSGTATVNSYTFGENEPQINISSSTNPVAGAKIYYRLVGKNDYVQLRPTDAGKYEVKVVLESSKNYKECTIYATFEIFKAEQPNEMPDSEIVVGRNIEKLSEVKLPSGWDWEEPEMGITLERIIAYAKYRDIKNYNKYRVIVTIIKESRKDISVFTAKVNEDNFIYDGSEKTPGVTVTDGETELRFKQDYELEYSDNTDAGKAKIIIHGINNYTGTKEIYFTILKAEGSGTVSVDSYTFGENETQVIISSSTNPIAGAKIYYRIVGDHEFVELRPTDAGKYEIKVVLESSKNYKECTIYATFEIFKAEQPDEMPDSEIVVGRNIEKLSEVKLPSGWDWEEPETKISSERITAYAKYHDTKNYNKCRVSVTVIKESRKDISVFTAKVNEDNFIYDGSEKIPGVTVMDGETELRFKQDYELEYSDNTDAGRAKIIIRAVNNYTGTKEVYFTILKAEGSGTVSVDSYTFGESESQVNISSSTNPLTGAKIYYRLVGDYEFVELRPTDAGKYEVKVVLESSKNYKECTIYATFEIFKAEQPDEMPDSEIVVGRNIEKLSEVKLPSGWDWEEPETGITLERITAYAKYRDTKNYNKFRVIVIVIKESRKDISAFTAKVNEDNFIYDGSEKTPGVTVMDGETELRFKQDYELEYFDNTDAGRAKIIIRGINNYMGTKEIYFTILKAEQPVVNTIIKLSKRVKRLSEVELPAGFVWEDGNLLIKSDKTIAKAIYMGEDASNYNVNEILFIITIEAKSEIKEKQSKDWILPLVITVAVLAAVATTATLIVLFKRKSKQK